MHLRRHVGSSLEIVGIRPGDHRDPEVLFMRDGARLLLPSTVIGPADVAENPHDLSAPAARIFDERLEGTLEHTGLNIFDLQLRDTGEEPQFTAIFWANVDLKQGKVLPPEAALIKLSEVPQTSVDSAFETGHAEEAHAAVSAFHNPQANLHRLLTALRG